MSVYTFLRQGLKVKFILKIILMYPNNNDIYIYLFAIIAITFITILF